MILPSASHSAMQMHDYAHAKMIMSNASSGMLKTQAERISPLVQQ